MTNPAQSSDFESKQDSMLEGLGKIKVPKSSDVLAERLKKEILSDAYPPGSMLPTERELVTTTGLSRGSVREALRILEAQGLVATRAGRYGGTTVSMPSDDQLAGQINIFARGRSIPLTALAEVRLALEPMVASLAAQRRTAEDLTALREISDRIDQTAIEIDDLEEFLMENVNWHDALAAASHNDLLCALATSVSGLMFEASKLREFASLELRQRVCLAHRKILEAIEGRDSERARRRAEIDIEAYARILDSAAKGSVTTA
ncbi:FadR family transcriptional regulator [Tsuneonella sp. YG55]|uniref:FadR family transcriptional regulator n=1 Tax=Tsuneonella litorea TaxID=2976475 RepID=A0A9X3AJV2_9SPHN|nr:FadR/GntR family transcriptional regulator [Tsuneonella litorea]MCT2557509.1 FadR family transcriptional regulator [Tsuneonella litorea]